MARERLVYVLCFDQLNPNGVLRQEYAIKMASLDAARKAYREIASESVFYILAHARIIGPEGEVYAVEEPEDGGASSRFSAS